MRELERCLELYKQAKELDERIEEINTVLYTPKVQDLSGMPKGNGGAESIVDKLVDKKNKLINKRYEVKMQLAHSRDKVSTMMNECNLTDNEKLLIQYRFFYGLSWKRVGEELEWNENKVFRVYRKINANLTEFVAKL